eukprot:15458777-Alexandrium_andersonii.AAC.1
MWLRPQPLPACRQRTFCGAWPGTAVRRSAINPQPVPTGLCALPNGFSQYGDGLYAHTFYTKLPMR